MSKDYYLICLDDSDSETNIKIGNNLCNRMFILMFMERIGNLMNDHQITIYCGTLIRKFSFCYRENYIVYQKRHSVGSIIIWRIDICQ